MRQLFRRLLPERVVERVVEKTVKVEVPIERTVLLEVLRQPFQTSHGSVIPAGDEAHSFAMDAERRLYKLVGEEWIPQSNMGRVPPEPSYVEALYKRVPFACKSCGFVTPYHNLGCPERAA